MDVAVLENDVLVEGAPINKLLSRQLRVPPLPDGEGVIYKLIGWGDPNPLRTDLKGNPLPNKPGYLMVGEKTIYDPFLKRKVTISNIKSTKKFKGPGGLEMTKEVPESVYFSPDKLVYVDSTQQETYAFMERVDENASNPFRDKKKKAWFHKVDANVKIEENREKNYFLLDALNWVMKTASIKDLKSCALTVNKYLPSPKQIPTEYPHLNKAQEFELLKNALFELAQVNPQLVLKGSSDEISQIKIQMLDAEKKNIIFFNTNEKAYYRHWMLNISNDLETICEVKPGKDKVDGLLEYLTTEKGRIVYLKVVKKLEEILTPR